METCVSRNVEYSVLVKINFDRSDLVKHAEDTSRSQCTHALDFAGTQPNYTFTHYCTCIICCTTLRSRFLNGTARACRCIPLAAGRSRRVYWFPPVPGIGVSKSLRSTVRQRSRGRSRRDDATTMMLCASRGSSRSPSEPRDGRCTSRAATGTYSSCTCPRTWRRPVNRILCSRVRWTRSPTGVARKTRNRRPRTAIVKYTCIVQS